MFIKHAGFIKDRLVLLVLENCQSHLAINVVLALEDGAVLLYFTPHSCHIIQCLGRSVYGPYVMSVDNASNA
jgi:hypothetical protein